MSNTQPLLIGQALQSFGNPPWFTGVIEQLAIWNAARTAIQVDSDFANQLVGTESGLAALWRFNETQGTTARDATANHNDGVLGAGVSANVPARVQGQLRDFPNFDTLTPTHTMLDDQIDYFGSAADFAGFADLDDLFAALDGSNLH